MDKQEEVTEVVQEDVEAVDPSEILYANKTLTEWDEELTIEMPSMPCTSLEIDRTCSDLNNKYQTAYNMYNNLYVGYKELQSRLRGIVNKEIEKILADLPGKARPGRDTLETMAYNKNSEVRRYEKKIMEVSILKDFFEHHRNKLKDIMLLTNSLSYSTNQSDRMYEKSNRHQGM